ncbi:MAG: DUF134 domain-containing protein [Nitrospirota bacterium]|nr:DUF134 domain-containing protein [Nitrospirota bacterium]
MPRPKISRFIRTIPAITYFKPRGVPMSRLEEVRLGVDELEALRLCDMEGLYHDKAADLIGVSRQTLGRILEQARKKVIEALVHGKALRIEGPHDARILTLYTCSSCSYQWQEALEPKKTPFCPKCRSQNKVGLG